MSGISSVGSSNPSLYPLTTSNSGDVADTISTDITGAGSTAISQDSSSSGGTQTTSPLGDLRDQIETAVTDAVNQLPPDSSPDDVFSAVKNAVHDTLKANGLDPQQVGGQHHGHHHHAHAAGGGASGGNDGDADDLQDDANPLTAPGTTSADALVTLLQQLTGGDSQNAATADSASDPTSLIGPSNSATQATSLLSALQNNSGNGVNLTNVFAQLFQGFPNGTGLDVRA
jgi:hypothetical protein